jgi:general secretion pathway protein I
LNSPRLKSRAQALAAGFSLLEILVAFTLMALIVTVLMRVFSGGLQGAGVAEDYARATSLAENKLGGIGSETPLAPGEISGTEAGKYRWKITVRGYDDKAAGAAPPQPQALMRVQLMEVAVSVDWSDYGKDRQVAMTTLVLAAKS